MKLNELLIHTPILRILGSPEIEVTGIHTDSRKIEPGFLFLAVRGTQTDGHQYLDQAIENGATAILCEALPESPCPEITYVLTASSEKAVGLLATQFYGDPSSKLCLIGVTGTNGKTTIATLLYKVFRTLGYPTGLLSTVCNYINEISIEATHTTPDPVSLNQLLAQMVESGCQYVFMEVSSHAVAQHRINGLHFKGGIFTNLTRDHLDYHKTFDQYRDAKKAFFDALPADAFALTNLDDRNGPVMLQNTKATPYGYSLRTLCEFKGKVLESHFDGTLLQINQKEVAVQFVGKFNASNLLAVYGASVLLGQDPEAILLALSTLGAVNGRFETLHAPQGYTAIVDYAHTPDALVNVLDTIHEVLQGKGKVITVVGAGGNRDKGKRPLMAQESAKRSDRVILTSDNPRFEDPQSILNDMEEGMTPELRKKVLRIADRKEAIRAACMMADKGDVILIAGKGHENYQEIQGVKHHFDDKEVVRELMALTD